MNELVLFVMSFFAGYGIGALIGDLFNLFKKYE